MPTRNVNLTDHFDRFIESGVASGRYGNASEMIREGLRLLEQRTREEQSKLKWLRGAVKEGLNEIDRSEYTTLRSGQAIDDFIHQLGEEASGEAASGKIRA